MAQAVDVALGSGGTVRHLALYVLAVVVAETVHEIHRLFLALHLQRGHVNGDHVAQLGELTGPGLVQPVAAVLETHVSVLLALVGVAPGHRSALGQD